jgi:hypothetical protein
MQNKSAFGLGLLGGILMISAGVVGSVGFWALLPQLATILGLPPEFTFLVNLVLIVLGFVAGLGGFAVVVGSLLFLTKRVRLGKFIVGLGAGMGLFGLILMLAGQTLSGTLAVTWLLAVLQTPGLLGVILSILARMMAKPVAG